MVRPPPQSVDDLEDLTGEPREVPLTSATNNTFTPSDRRKVHSLTLVVCIYVCRGSGVQLYCLSHSMAVFAMREIPIVC